VNRKIVFFSVFVFTLVSTLLVFSVCLLSNQTWLVTILFTLSTMWVIGILSQLALHHLYLSVVKPIEDKAFEKKIRKMHEHNYAIEEIEKISDFKEKYESEVVNEESDEISMNK
jgi:LPS O-antigen subunit length determinant protein (WzzB/FepE family)